MKVGGQAGDVRKGTGGRAGGRVIAGGGRRAGMISGQAGKRSSRVALGNVRYSVWMVFVFSSNQFSCSIQL